jgi:dsRNA-specific ribonuclease
MSPRTNKVSNSTKGNRKNSKLATIGDAVIELFVREELASNDDSSAEISWEKQRYVSNEDLKARAIALGLDKLEIFELNSQQSEDYASLLEAIVG